MANRLRLDKLLANMGFGTRSEIKRAVKLGKVTVDGNVARESGQIIEPERHVVQYEGESVVYRDVIYMMMNKPSGVISATEDTRDKTVVDLLKPEDSLLKPFPVGRLDKDTVGLLLLTNDGALAHELLSPKKHVDKTYEALVLGKVGESDIEAFAMGVTLDDGYMTMPGKLVIEEHSDRQGEPCSFIRLTIREGKFHQVKRMFEAVGKRVLTLKRISMGPLRLDDALEEGQYRELTPEEVSLLKGNRQS
ncbi:rRNA pseudouridine synthase [Paenibacillus sp. J5C_2022]|uniref:pseudouridine synthase n=1 Tax=Paenibacillus sp. J5C2022 TaxID=2977129 RepID=UPI0021CF03C3|nr:pseudouridine synthase [Paenibacillus sp. J5C2022]MCU6707629.1 rRNA pseudouridine synthase [Paenibacillus sp. J5C2022]